MQIITTSAALKAAKIEDGPENRGLVWRAFQNLTHKNKGSWKGAAFEGNLNDVLSEIDALRGKPKVPKAKTTEKPPKSKKAKPPTPTPAPAPKEAETFSMTWEEAASHFSPTVDPSVRPIVMAIFKEFDETGRGTLIRGRGSRGKSRFEGNEETKSDLISAVISAIRNHHEEAAAEAELEAEPEPEPVAVEPAAKKADRHYLFNKGLNRPSELDPVRYEDMTRDQLVKHLAWALPQSMPDEIRMGEFVRGKVLEAFVAWIDRAPKEVLGLLYWVLTGAGRADQMASVVASLQARAASVEGFLERVRADDLD